MRKFLAVIAFSLVLSLCMFGSAFADEVKFVNVISGSKVIASLPYVNDDVVSYPYYIEVDGTTYVGNGYNIDLKESDGKLYVLLNYVSEYPSGQARYAESLGGYEIESDGKYGYEINGHNIKFINNADRSLRFIKNWNNYTVPYMEEFGVLNSSSLVVTDFVVPLNTTRDELESMVDLYNASQTENNSGSSSDTSGDGNSGSSSDPSEGGVTLTGIVSENVESVSSSVVDVLADLLPYALGVLGAVLVCFLAYRFFKRYIS